MAGAGPAAEAAGSGATQDQDAADAEGLDRAAETADAGRPNCAGLQEQARERRSRRTGRQ